MITKKINTEWHLANKMPKKATLDQRIQWHQEHLKYCKCRTKVPEKLQVEMRKRGIEIPNAS